MRPPADNGEQDASEPLVSNEPLHPFVRKTEIFRIRGHSAPKLCFPGSNIFFIDRDGKQRRDIGDDPYDVAFFPEEGFRISCWAGADHIGTAKGVQSAELGRFLGMIES